MRYQMKQKIFAFGDDFFIKDDLGNDAFFVDGKAFTIGDKLSFQDLQGSELLFINQKLLSFAPTYEIHQDGHLAAVVKKELLSFFKARFTVDVPGPYDLTAEGNLLDMEYKFMRGNQVVATVSKKWFAMGDTYGVDIADDEDDILILAATVVIDLCCHGDDDRR